MDYSPCGCKELDTTEHKNGQGDGTPLQYSCLENPMDRGAWWATVYGVARVGHDLATKPPPPFNHQTDLIPMPGTGYSEMTSLESIL